MTQTSLFDYVLPPERIAQAPAEPRDASRLLVLHRATGAMEHRKFRDIGDYLHAPDILAANDSRVIPARLAARKSTGGRVEVFLLECVDDDDTRWRCLVRGRNLRAGTVLSILPQDTENQTASARQNATAPHARIEEELAEGLRIVRFDVPVQSFLDTYGSMPLPPYITQFQGDRERYQTIYSRLAGSVAAPTAGLHFTPDLLVALRRRDIGFETVTLHVGLDTFRPVEAEDAATHPIHSEWAELSSATAQAVNQTTLAGGRIVAVGTTAVRTLEWAAHIRADQGQSQADNHADANPEIAACPWQRVSAFSGYVDLFIRPGYKFRAVDALITNFHLPRSTLLMLVSAFAGQPHPQDHDKGRQMILAAYHEAIEKGYRFYSFGDAMLII